MNECYLLIQVLLRLLHAVGKVVLRKFIGVVHIFDDTHIHRFALSECSAHEPGPLLCPRSCLEIHHLSVARFLVLGPKASIVLAASGGAAANPVAAAAPLLT